MTRATMIAGLVGGLALGAFLPVQGESYELRRIDSLGHIWALDHSLSLADCQTRRAEFPQAARVHCARTFNQK